MPQPNPTDYPFVHQAVRDLAFLLKAPAPWASSHNLPLGLLLGPEGEALLTRLDRAPQPLEAWLARNPVSRLGRYAERLLGFWFTQVAHIELCAANQVLQDGNRTVGEFDFLLRIDGAPWHIETASKFYLQLGTTLDTLVGPDLRDTWRLKAQKIERQLVLSRHPLAHLVIPEDFLDCRCAALLTGWFFYRGSPLVLPPLCAAQYTGWLANLHEPWPLSAPDSRWCCLPRLEWLSPALKSDTDVMRSETLLERLTGLESPQMVAEMQPGEQGWFEVARGFVLPSHWPGESVKLALSSKKAASRRQADTQ
jgi:hypothetical protein